MVSSNPPWQGGSEGHGELEASRIKKLARPPNPNISILQLRNRRPLADPWAHRENLSRSIIRRETSTNFFSFSKCSGQAVFTWASRLFAKDSPCALVSVEHKRKMNHPARFRASKMIFKFPGWSSCLKEIYRIMFYGNYRIICKLMAPSIGGTSAPPNPSAIPGACAPWTACKNVRWSQYMHVLWS